MMKRTTTRHRRHARQSVLQVRVMSPRIVWFGFLGWLSKAAKLACLLAMLAGIGWGLWRGVRHAFHQNPDFRLQVIQLNENPVIDELGVAAAAGIDLTACPSLFEIDIRKASEELKSRPEIIDASIERHLPGTLVVRVVPRLPKAWVRCPKAGWSQVRSAGGILADHEGVAYPCPERQLQAALALPVIDLPAPGAREVALGEKLPQPELARCFRLLDAARRADPDAVQWIESIRQRNDWSLELVTRHGTTAVFSLGDHERQIESLRAALDHAGEKGYTIATINLIPKHNIPITLLDDATPPKAIPITLPPAGAADPQAERRARDLSTLLERN
jgi:hypothetical protein